MGLNVPRDDNSGVAPQFKFVEGRHSRGEA
jgi:hypothetical protein